MEIQIHPELFSAIKTLLLTIQVQKHLVLYDDIGNMMKTEEAHG